MHSLNIFNMYSQSMKDRVNSIPPSTWIASLRALLFSALTSTFALALPSERDLSSCGLPLLLLSPHSLHFNHTVLFVDPWHSRHTPAPGLFLLSETFLFQILVEFDTSTWWSLPKCYLIRKTFSLASFKVAPTPPPLSPFLVLFPPSTYYHLTYYIFCLYFWNLSSVSAHRDVSSRKPGDLVTLVHFSVPSI